MTDSTQLELWELAPTGQSDSLMVRAVKSTLQVLSEAERLPPERAGLAQLCLALAQSIDGGARSGRASAVAMAAAQLRETLLVLDPPPEDGDAAANAERRLAELVTALEAAADSGVTRLRAVQ